VIEQTVSDYLNYLESRHYSLSRSIHASRILERILFLREEYSITDCREVTEPHLAGFSV